VKGRVVIESRKQAVSIRMNVSDVRKVKKLAGRLGVRDSDVIRFAVKSMLGRLGPLYDAEVRGRNLVPVFVEFGTELLRFFDLDGTRLEAIVNEGVEPTKRVDREDIALLALTGAQEPYAALKLSELNRNDNSQMAPAELASSLRQYLYEKYVYRGSANGNGEVRALETLHLAVAGGHHD
jgi:hypothetical protein